VIKACFPDFPVNVYRLSSCYGIWAARESVPALVLSVIAFHEKAGRSQVDSFLLDKVFVFLPAESPLSPPFHPHS
jgi:hypothetical protein